MLASENFPTHHFKESIFKPYSTSGDDLAAVNSLAATSSPADSASAVAFETASKMLATNGNGITDEEAGRSCLGQQHVIGQCVNNGCVQSSAAGAPSTSVASGQQSI